MTRKPHILFVNRKRCEFVSIERVFEQVARSLDDKRFSSETAWLTFGFGIAGIILNLVLFRRSPADIYHVTGHTHYIALRLPRDRTVLTIHDLRFLLGGGRLRRWLKRKLFLDWPVRRAAVVTAVSDTTREEIIAETGCPPEKVVVIPNPLRVEFLETVHIGSGGDRRTVLQVGTMENKNLPNLVEALKGIDCTLRIIGDLTPKQREMLDDSKMNYTNDKSLGVRQILSAYKEADLLAFVSTLEGFGLPIIEAQAIGLPVVTSRLSPMCDVAGEGALLADPSDPQDIKRCISLVLSDEGLRRRLVENGKRNVERFEAGAVAAAYEDVYFALSGAGK